MNSLQPVHRRHIGSMRKSVLAYQHLLAGITQEEATTYRDSGDGWTAVEIVCHVRDFDRIFFERAQRILNEDAPRLVPRDHEQLAQDGNYNAQDKNTVIADLMSSRETMAQFFEGLTEDQWLRAGHHPEKTEPFTLAEAAAQVCSHDADHLEQLTRVLLEKRTPGS
jgi:hypothetical protein